MTVPLRSAPAPEVCTVEQAALVVDVLNGHMGVSGSRALGTLLRRDAPVTFEEYERDFPPGSPQAEDVHNALALGEVLGGLVKLGLVPRSLVAEMLWVDGIWQALGPVALGMREHGAEPRLYENLEALAALPR